ncbi:hypothetical protein FJY71_01795 [candidate division WOR-3 bacterium]|nr:hypothetical protein [candidate division WOR-3 bacterium]
MLKRTTAVVALSLMMLVCLPAVSSAQYMPRWQVGDWWVIKTLEKYKSRNWGWYHHRYEVLRMERVNGRDCYVLESRDPDGQPQGVRELYHIRTDSLLPIRQTHIWAQSNRLLPPAATDYPDGVPRIYTPDLQLPYFPLDTAYVRDTMFTCRPGEGYVRNVTRVADSVTVRRLLDTGDSCGERVPRPSGGPVYAVRSEAAGGPPPLPPPPGRPWPMVWQTNQLWCDTWPWCVYEEHTAIDNRSGTRRLYSRSWLVRVGHSGGGRGD